MDRRSVLRAAALAAVPAIGGTGLAVSGSTAAFGAPAATVDLGPAALACNTLSGGFVGDQPYIVSHLMLPARLGIFDAAAEHAVNLTELPTGGGAWASLADDTTIYIGTHTVADLYRFDTETMALDRLGNLPGATYVWDMCRTPDGKIYLGTYPDGKVWELDPATGAVRAVAVALPGQTYVRSIIADADTIYAGVGAQAHLVAIDRASGTAKDITPPELAGEAFVYQLAQTSTHVIAGTHGTGQIAIVDKSDPTSYRIVHPDGVITIGKMATDGNDVYFGAGYALWHLDLVTGTTTQLATTADGDFVTAVHVRGGKVVVFTNSATMWTYDIATAAMTMADLQAAGMPTAPELPQSVHSMFGRQAYVGGHGGVEVHEPARPEATSRIRIAGEAKAMTHVGRFLYIATYPSASIVRHDPATGQTTVVAMIGNEQNRPGDIAAHARRNLLLVASSPDYGKVGGALSILQLDTSELNVYRNLVEGHAHVSTAAHPSRDIGYVGTERPSGATASATVVSFDLATRRRIAEIVPVSGAVSILSLAVLGDVLYGTTNAGVLFAVDARSGAVLGTATIATARTGLVVADDRLFAVSHQRLVRVTPGSLATEVVVDGLTADPTSFPMLAYDHGKLFTITGRNLLEVRPS
ncbi:hypothetical protein [Actinopolymorpha pittospori]|uniref:Outer membrane protein assembly factor BamB n=1 Tax=Actinopolymorpha pittospori TaxID=648752 RepID=A0A927N767_9ACTN|nr:hypothetical protein [Actinopolymorpha pittospori]MBE1610227.1 outer membrane protein assembly factor BamB [Actinopolymorpha pittospori]